MSNSALLDEAIEAIAALRDDGAHVHSITNTVAQNFTANVLLACGATVSMTANPNEIQSFVKSANALHINLGTLDQERTEAMIDACKLATEHSIPVTLDPVMVHVSELRRELAKVLLPSAHIIRGNKQEVEALRLRETHRGICIVKTGEIDEIHHSEKLISVSNGDPVMDQVIATGCALGALIAALSSKTKNPFIASLAGLVWFSVAGEVAAEKAAGPGSYQPAFLDELHNISVDKIRQIARLS